MTTSVEQAVRARMAQRAPRKDDRLAEILEPVTADLEQVTQRLTERLQNPVARMATYLITAGGKRLRPALVLLAGRSGDARKRQGELIDLATAVELIHTATLIHDDIIDESPVRRKQPTFHARFGTERAVLMGDYLYATAFSLLTELRDARVTKTMAEVCQELSRGEFQEVDSRYNLELTEAEYLRIVRDKTASLIAACGRLGALVAGAPDATVDRIGRFGLNFGLAFQIVDDCLDLIGDQRVVGKTLLSDLEKGSLSLPVIYLAHALGRQAKDRLFAPLPRPASSARRGGRSKTVTRAFIARIAQEARRTGAVAQAMDRAETFIREAMDAVAIRDGVALPGTYHALARYAIERRS